MYFNMCVIVAVGVLSCAWHALEIYPPLIRHCEHFRQHIRRPKANRQSVSCVIFASAPMSHENTVICAAGIGLLGRRGPKIFVHAAFHSPHRVLFTASPQRRHGSWVVGGRG